MFSRSDNTTARGEDCVHQRFDDEALRFEALVTTLTRAYPLCHDELDRHMQALLAAIADQDANRSSGLNHE